MPTFLSVNQFEKTSSTPKTEKKEIAAENVVPVDFMVVAAGGSTYTENR